MTLESFLTESSTPEALIDPITGVLYVQPVTLPISGKSISAYVIAQYPGFDIHANSQFGPDKVGVTREDKGWGYD